MGFQLCRGFGACGPHTRPRFTIENVREGEMRSPGLKQRKTLVTGTACLHTVGSISRKRSPARRRVGDSRECAKARARPPKTDREPVVQRGPDREEGGQKQHLRMRVFQNRATAPTRTYGNPDPSPRSPPWDHGTGPAPARGRPQRDVKAARARHAASGGGFLLAGREAGSRWDDRMR